MKTKRRVLGRCPTCGHEDDLDLFLEKSDRKYGGGLVTAPARIRCPSCNANLKFKHRGLQLTFSLFVFSAFVTVVIFMPEHISSFGYAVGVIFLVVYLMQRLRFHKKPHIFVKNE